MAPHVRTWIGLGILPLLALSGCSAPSEPAAPASPTRTAPAAPTTSGPTASSSRSPAPSTPAASASSSKPVETTQAAPNTENEARQLVQDMTVEQQSASLIMAGVPATGADAAEVQALKDQGIANIFLRGRSQLSVKQTAQMVEGITEQLQSLLPEGLPVWVATDQEGGYVRVLQGSGFTELPTALKQGAWSTKKLASQWEAVGEDLARAGINVNLAPVADTVPTKIGTSNAPIGYFGREYSHDPQAAAESVTTINAALQSAKVQPVVKHFPSLGRVTNNTDVSSHVTDTVISSDSKDLLPFKEAIEQGKSWVMISNARYTKIDEDNDAPFSRKLVTGLLRDELGYDGLIISDDLCEAQQVQGVEVGQRAVRFIRAGGTMPLCVNANDALSMAGAIAAEASQDEDFAAQVEQAALLVVREKLEMSS